LFASVRDCDGYDQYCWNCHFIIFPFVGDYYRTICNSCKRSFHTTCLSQAEKTKLPLRHTSDPRNVVIYSCYVCDLLFKRLHHHDLLNPSFRNNLDNQYRCAETLRRQVISAVLHTPEFYKLRDFAFHYKDPTWPAARYLRITNFVEEALENPEGSSYPTIKMFSHLEWVHHVICCNSLRSDINMPHGLTISLLLKLCIKFTTTIKKEMTESPFECHKCNLLAKEGGSEGTAATPQPDRDIGGKPAVLWPCPIPHGVVMVRQYRQAFWPGLVIKVSSIECLAEVLLFGTHERQHNVPFKNCRLLPENYSRTQKEIKKGFPDYQKAQNEVDVHLRLLRQEYGVPYCFASRNGQAMIPFTIGHQFIRQYRGIK
jgi:hypothetical protein